MKKLRDKILNYNCPVIFYELLPPMSDSTDSALEAYIECTLDLLMSTPIGIDAVNIPEIRLEEHGKNQQAEAFIPKLNPAYFAQMLESASYKHLEVILNHCTVYEPWEEQLKWLEETHQHDIRVIILVGGTSSKIHYPGPSVLEASDYINTHYKQELLCGGITIQTRRSHDPNKDEPQRLITKTQHGIEFFTTQVIYESLSIKLLLNDYARLCQEQGVPPKRIFLSFAPISTSKDLDFLHWLGVVIPKSVEHELFKANIGIGWRSGKIAVNILQEILYFMRDEKIEIPLGLNIEHITRHNFELSLEFITRLGKLYKDYMGQKTI